MQKYDPDDKETFLSAMAGIIHFSAGLPKLLLCVKQSGNGILG